MKGFRPVASPNSSESVSKEVPRKPLVEVIVSELVGGKTAAMVAQDHHLPLEFVTLILERARSSGQLEFFELKPGSCTKGSCDPDPESLVCAGCPIMPAAIRRKQSLTGKLFHRTE